MLIRAGYLESYGQHSDLQQYLELYVPEAAEANYTFSIASVFSKKRRTCFFSRTLTLERTTLDTPVPQDDVYFGNTEGNLDTQAGNCTSRWP